MYPPAPARNRTPSSTAEPSLTVTTAGVAVLGQIVHGQPDDVVPVVNDHENGDMVWPAVSRAPDTVAVWTVDGASAAAGVNVTVRVAASYPVLPDTDVAPAARARLAVPAWIGSLSVALTVVVTGTPVALAV